MLLYYLRLCISIDRGRVARLQSGISNEFVSKKRKNVKLQICLSMTQYKCLYLYTKSRSNKGTNVLRGNNPTAISGGYRKSTLFSLKQNGGRRQRDFCGLPSDHSSLRRRKNKQNHWRSEETAMAGISSGIIECFAVLHTDDFSHVCGSPWRITPLRCFHG